MGKKSLTKSTTKKKTVAKKTDETKTAAAQAAPQPPKKAGPQKTTAPPKTPAPAKSSQQPKKPTLKSLISKDFGSWAPPKMYAPPVDKDASEKFTAPPVIETTDKAEAGALKKLMARQFDLTAVDKPSKTEATEKAAPSPPQKEAKAPEKPVLESPVLKKETTPPPKAAPAPKKPVSITELIQRSFGAWQPDQLYSPKTDQARDRAFSAPPFVDAADPAEAGRIKALLSKTFDLTVTEPSPKPAPKPVEPEVKAAPEPQATPQAPVKEAVSEAPAPAPAPEKAPESIKPEPIKPEAPKSEVPKSETPKPEAPKPEEKKPAPEKSEAKQPEIKKPAPSEKPAKPKAEAIKETPKTPTPPPPPTPHPLPKTAQPQKPPVNPALAILIALVVGVFGLLILASAMNTGHYYLKPADGGVEIWQGKFSPTGKKLVMTVPGAVLPDPVKSEYARSEALVPAFNYYIQKAEALSETKGKLDFDVIKSTLDTAMEFAPTPAHRKDVGLRLNKIDFMLMTYKADVAAGKKTIEGYESALEYLAKAAVLGVDTPSAKALLEKKTAEVTEALEALKQKQWEKESIAAAVAETEKAAAEEKEKSSEEAPADSENTPSPPPETSHH